MTTYRRDDAIAEVYGPDRVTLLLLSEPGSAPVALAGTGVAVWEELDCSPCELGQVVSAVAHHFHVDESLVEDDVRGLCEQLVRVGLLVRTSEDAGSRSRAS